MPSALNVVTDSSRLALRTRASGLFARLAHDLEIASKQLSGRVELEGDSWSAEVVVPVESLRVAGTLSGDRLDGDGLSESDRAEVERRVREEVLRGVTEVRVHAAGASRTQGEATVQVGDHAQKVRVTLRVAAREGGFWATGAARVSLEHLGVSEVKGPLGAFKIDDGIEVRFEIAVG